MKLSPSELVLLAEAYLEALAGGDVIDAARLHAAKAKVNIRFLPNASHIPAIVFVNKILNAANAQNKLDLFLRAVADEGIELNCDFAEFEESNPSKLFPKVEISWHPKYFLTGTTYTNHPLIVGSIYNPLPFNQRVLLKISLNGTQDVIQTSIDLPEGRSNLPFIRMFSFTLTEATRIEKTFISSILNIEVYLAGKDSPIDVFQKEVFIAQPDVCLLARRLPTGEVEDYSSSLAGWVNSGIPGLAELLAQRLPPSIRSNLGYSLYDSQHVENQIRALYDIFQEDKYVFLPTELISLNNSELIQRVKHPNDVINNPVRRANCLDGAILFASVLEYIGIHPLLVILPRHALVGWKNRPIEIQVSDFEQFINVCGFLDTTYISTDLGFDVAVSSAQGYLSRHMHLIGRQANSLNEFASVVDIKNIRLHWLFHT